MSTGKQKTLYRSEFEHLAERLEARAQDAWEDGFENAERVVAYRRRAEELRAAAAEAGPAPYEREAGDE